MDPKLHEQQRTKSGNQRMRVTQEWAPVTSGAPLSSVPGPVLSIIYNNVWMLKLLTLFINLQIPQ